MAQKLLKGRILDRQGRPLDFTLGLDERQLGLDNKATKLLVITDQGSVGWVERSTLQSDATKDPDSLHLNTSGEIYTLPTDTPADGDVFIFEDKSVGYKKRKVLWETLEATLDHDSLSGFVAAEHVDWATDQGGSPAIHLGNLDAIGLQEAYAQGATSDGRQIDVSASTASPVWIYSSHLTAAWMLYANWVAAGTLASNSVGQVIYDSKRTHTAATTINDDWVNHEVTRWSVMNNAGGTFNSAGAVQFLRIRNTQTAGTLASTCKVAQWNVPSASTWTGPLLYASYDSDANPFFRITKTGALNWGAGGASATDCALSRSAAGIIDATSVLNPSTGFRVNGAAADGDLLEGNGTNYVPMGRLKVWKTTDETVNNSATLQDDDALVLALATGTSYRFNFEVYWSTDDTADFQFLAAFTGTSSALYVITEFVIPAGTTMIREEVRTSFATYTANASGGSTHGYARIIGIITTTSTGNLKLTWAQATMNASDTKVLIGSSLEAVKVQ